MNAVFIAVVMASILMIIFWALSFLFTNTIDKHIDYSNDSSIEDMLGGKRKNEDWDDNKQHTEQNV